MIHSEYDYIVVGAGASGCTIAREILERQLGSVLLIEAGGVPRSPRLRVPSQYLEAFGSRWDWDHATVPQTGLAQRRIRLPAGKALGGSTAINAMIAIEAPDGDFEVWSHLLSDEWSPFQVRQAYRRVHEWLNLCADRWDPAGRLPSLPPLHPRMQSFLEHASQGDWTAVSFPNGFDAPRIGIDAYRRMQRHGRRVSVWNLFHETLHDKTVASSSAFTLLSDRYVHRVVFEKETAIGIETRRDGTEATLMKARLGVIVCAGAIETPRLLMTSGLGDSVELAWAGIECRAELPELGKNLQDHMVYPIVMRSRAEPERAVDSRVASRIEYVRHRTGARSSNLAELGGFFRCDAPTFDALDRSLEPEFQWHITPTHYLEYPPFESRHPCVSFAITPLRPLSRGNLRPALAKGTWDPAGSVPLAIDPGYLGDSRDAESFLNAIAWSRNAIAASPWRDLVGDEVFPRDRRSDPQRPETYLRRFASTIYHYAGTCGMGNRTSSCLDARFRVRGLERLWVCDASAMPQLVRCNPQFTVMMMAMRLADWLSE